MKRKFLRPVSIVIAAAIVMGFLTGISFGSDISEMIRVYRNRVVLEVNQTRVGTDNFLYNGTTYIPLRAVSELLGKQVGWNAVTNVASINEAVYEKESLSKLLPAEAGYHWLYNGFAEYDHEMTLDLITDQPQRRIYGVSGSVGDPSGGASTANLTIQLRYILENNSLIQEKTEDRMMDSAYDRLTLIQTPLVVGTFWNETVTDKTGAVKIVSSQIMKVEILDGGIHQYTVHYRESGSLYFEQRVLRDGVGVVALEKLYQSEQGESFSIGYFLVEEMVMNEMDLTLYFPDNMADKVWPEVRTVNVDDSRTAWAVLQELIAGPQKEGLYPSMPIGTTVLDLSISNRICTVDFSREFIDNHPGGSAGELLTLASIVNTLTEFSSIDKVMILVEGRAGETLGNIVLDHAMERMPEMLGE